MKPGILSLITALALLAGCGRSPNALVKFTGMTPQSSKVKDDRKVKAFCPQCKQHVDANVTQCPDLENCGAEITLKEDYPCPFCEATGDCATCVILQQTNGKCWNCNGVGYLTYQGKTKPCPNCGSKDKEGEGKCMSCKGDQKCDYCGGEGKVSGSNIKNKLQVKPGEDEQPDPADAP